MTHGGVMSKRNVSAISTMGVSSDREFKPVAFRSACGKLEAAVFPVAGDVAHGMEEAIPPDEPAVGWPNTLALSLGHCDTRYGPPTAAPTTVPNRSVFRNI